MNNEERFFIPTPTPTDKWAANSEGVLFPVYLDVYGKEMKWSGKKAVPAVGDRVYMNINSIGWGSVKGYAESHGWLGLMVEPENPPDWWKKQRRNNASEHAKGVRTYPKWILDGICCVFGAEIETASERSAA